MEDKLFFHRPIKFDILRQTEKALLIKVKELYSDGFHHLIDLYGEECVEPVELWCPKSWLKLEGDQFWIWEEGFLKNVMKLFKKRFANLTEEKKHLQCRLEEETIH